MRILAPSKQLELLLKTRTTFVVDTDTRRLASLAVNELRKLVQSGDLGKIYCVETERVNLGLFRNDINVIWDLASHDISILLYLFGEKPRQIKVQANDNLQPRIYDVAHLDLSFASPIAAYRYGAVTIPHLDWIEPLHLECEDFANAIRLGIQPRAHGEVGLEVVRVLAAAQEILEAQES